MSKQPKWMRKGLTISFDRPRNRTVPFGLNCLRWCSHNGVKPYDTKGWELGLGWVYIQYWSA